MENLPSIFQLRVVKERGSFYHHRTTQHKPLLSNAKFQLLMDINFQKLFKKPLKENPSENG